MTKVGSRQFGLPEFPRHTAERHATLLRFSIACWVAVEISTPHLGPVILRLACRFDCILWIKDAEYAVRT